MTTSSDQIGNEMTVLQQLDMSLMSPNVGNFQLKRGISKTYNIINEDLSIIKFVACRGVMFCVIA